jgi:hypothetical protein
MARGSDRSTEVSRTYVLVAAEGYAVRPGWGVAFRLVLVAFAGAVRSEVLGEVSDAGWREEVRAGRLGVEAIQTPWHNAR